MGLWAHIGTDMVLFDIARGIVSEKAHIAKETDPAFGMVSQPRIL